LRYTSDCITFDIVYKTINKNTYIMKKPLITLAVASALLSSPFSTVADTLIHAGKVFTGTSNSLQENVTIVVEDNKIKAVKKGFAEAQEGEV